LTGSSPTPKTIGIAEVASFAARAASGKPGVTMTATRRLGAGSRPHLTSVFQGRRKSNNIHASSGVIWGIPAKILPQIPLGRLGEPEEIADLVIYLWSDEAAFVTGANIAINGGQHMR
jgi:NAD(P)-dependent dehydrogenase (short-subunit alcohol dehydrogenase family)